MAERPEVVYRLPIFYRAIAPALGFCICMGLVYLGFFQPGVGPHGTPDGSNASSIFVVATLAWLGFGWLTAGSRVALGGGVLTIENPWGRYAVAVDQIEKIEPGLILGVRLTSGQTITAWAVQASPFSLSLSRPNLTSRVASDLTRRLGDKSDRSASIDSLEHKGPRLPLSFVLGEAAIPVLCILGYLSLPS